MRRNIQSFNSMIYWLMPSTNKKSLSEKILKRKKAIFEEDDVLEKMVWDSWYYFVIENYYDDYDISKWYWILQKENKSYGIIYTIDWVRVKYYQLYQEAKDFFLNNNY